MVVFYREAAVSEVPNPELAEGEGSLFPRVVPEFR
jgi:hypothetical protein